MKKGNNKDERKVAIYSRKSKYTGKGESTQNQIEACKRKIELTFNHIDIEKDIYIYEDEGFTGANTNRPGFKKMLNDIRSGKIKAVIFYKLDRISRNVSDFSNLIEELERYKVSFLSATENLENLTPSGRAMMFMISVFSQLERDTIAERIRDNMHELAKTGRWLGGTTPTGYRSKQIQNMTIDGKNKKLVQLEIMEEEKMIVNTIFHKMIELGSLTKVETYMINNNLKTKTGKRFTRNTIRAILTNPVYAIADIDVLQYFKDLGGDIYAEEEGFNGKYGLMVYNKTEQKTKRVLKRGIEEWIIAIGKHKGFVSGEKWVKVQKIINQNSSMKYRKPTATNAILSGILRCSHCGSFMRPKVRGKRVDNEGRRTFDYMCELKEKSKRDKCDCKNINGLEADYLVFEEIRKLALPTSVFYKKLKEMSKNIFEQDKRETEELKELKAAMAKNENTIKKILEKIIYVDIELMDELSEKVKELKKTNENLASRIKHLTNNNYKEINDKETADIIINVLDTYFNEFNSLDLNTKRNMIKLLVSTVTTDGEDVTINFIGVRNIERLEFPTGNNSKRNINAFKSN